VELQAGSANSGDFVDYFYHQRQMDASNGLQDLAITLILVGGSTLVAGYFISRFIADRAIKPVSEAYEKQKQFIANASHELKTPIAVIDSNIEAEISGKKQPSKWLSNIQSETGRMDKLVSELLMLSKLDARENLLTISKFDASEVVEKIVGTVEPLIKEKSIKLSQNNEKPLMIESDKDKIHQVMTILIDNAIKYTKDGGKIEISTTSNKKHVEFMVKNSHKAIPVEDITRLFDRFYQADSSHNNAGHGLGLAIAKAVTDSIGATIEVSQSKGFVSFTLTV
jgi:signal transduction histidine kinase